MPAEEIEASPKKVANLKTPSKPNLKIEKEIIEAKSSDVKYTLTYLVKTVKGISTTFFSM